MSYLLRPLFAALFVLAIPLVEIYVYASTTGPVIVVTPDHANGVYAPNEKVTWTVDVTGDRTAFGALTYDIVHDGAVKDGEGTIDVSAGPATITASSAAPGVLLTGISSAKKHLALGGAVIAPEKITPSAPAPADFDDFWKAKVKGLEAVPLNPVEEKKDISARKDSAGVEYEQVTLDNVNGTHVHGQLACPATGEKFPAILICQYAGVYPLDPGWAIGPARAGWLVLNISAHDEPIDQPKSFYTNLQATTLKDYATIGSDDRERSYFVRMFLGDVQALNYLQSRPDWDGKTLLVTGTSQGGLQSFVTAALCPQVTAVAVNVPAGCDVFASLAQPPRAMGWPGWLGELNLKTHDPKKVQATMGYFDGINFAARVHCPTLVAVGLIDETARPTGVIAAYNSISAPKRLVIMPLSNHVGTGGTQKAWADALNEWKEDLQSGKTLPTGIAP